MYSNKKEKIIKEKVSKKDFVTKEKQPTKEEGLLEKKEVLRSEEDQPVKEKSVPKPDQAKPVLKEEEEIFVVKKTSLPKEETVPTSKLAETSRSLVKVPKAKTVTFVENETVIKATGKSGLEKFKSFFRISKKEPAEKTAPPSTKDDIPNPTPSNVSKPLVSLSESGGVSGIKKEQVIEPRYKSGMEKFKAFFNINEKESPKVPEPQPGNKEINESPTNAQSFFKRNDDGTSLSPSLSPYPYPFSVANLKGEHIQPQKPQKIPVLRPNMLDDVRRQFYDRYESQKSPSQRKQYHPGGNLAPELRKMIDSKITNEPYRFLDEGCNEVQVFDPNYVPIYDSMYDSSLFDDTEYILECVLAKMVKPEGWKGRVEDFKSSWEYGRFVTDCIVLDSTVLNGIRNGGKYVGTAISKLWRKDP